MKNHQSTTTAEKAKNHDTTLPLLNSMYAEFKELSKKKPDAAVSKSKILIVNRLLQKIREVLQDEDSIEFLDLLNEDDMPQTSDITLMLSQYVAAMEKFKEQHYGWESTSTGHTWFIED